MVTISGGTTSREMAEVINPAAGIYKLCAQAAGPNPMMHKLSSWIVKAGDVVSGTFNIALPASSTG